MSIGETASLKAMAKRWKDARARETAARHEFERAMRARDSAVSDRCEAEKLLYDRLARLPDSLVFETGGTVYLPIDGAVKCYLTTSSEEHNP